MPKRLYYALSPEKQSSIVEAALREFSEHPYDEASINQIIKRASISRGSFYLYFTDKEDLYMWIIDLIFGKNIDAFVQNSTQTEPPELFALYRNTFRYMLQVLDNPEFHHYITRLYQNMNYRIHAKIQETMEKQRSLFVLADNQFEPKEILTIHEIAAMLGLVNRDLLERKVAEGLSTAFVMELYDLRVSLIRQGFLQNIPLLYAPSNQMKDVYQK